MWLCSQINPTIHDRKITQALMNVNAATETLSSTYTPRELVSSHKGLATHHALKPDLRSIQCDFSSQDIKEESLSGQLQEERKYVLKSAL